MVDLKRGSRGKDVRWLQESLKKLAGQKIFVDGIFGGKTEVALNAFLKKNWRKPTGVVTQQVRELIYRELSKKVKSPFVLLPDGLNGIYKFFGADPPAQKSF